MTRMKPAGDAGTVEINDQEYVVNLDRDGNFRILDGHGGGIGSGKSLDSAVADARKRLTRDKVKVSRRYLRFKRQGIEFRFVPYEVFGYHRGNSAHMVRHVHEGGRAAPTEYQGYNRDDWSIDTPLEVQERYLQLHTQQLAISRQMKELEQEHQVSVRELYEKAVEEATTTQLEEK